MIADGATPAPLTAPTSQSSFTICMSGNAGMMAGANLYCGFTMNLFPESDGSYLVGAVESVGSTVGFQAGANVGFGIAWSPDPVLKPIGPNPGMALEAGPGVSGAASVSWNPTQLFRSLSDGFFDKRVYAMPTVRIGMDVGLGFPASASVAGGYTFLLAK